MHPSLQKLCDDARAMMAAGRTDAPDLIQARAEEFDHLICKAGNGHQRTLDNMRRDRVTAFDLRLAADEMRAIARGDAPALEPAE